MDMKQIRPKPIVTEEEIILIMWKQLRDYPYWQAVEYPEKIRVGRAHGLRRVTLHMNTGRIFDIKIKERRGRRKRGTITTYPA